MTRAALLAACLVAALDACMLRPRPTWRLMQPPEVQNESFPRGYQLLTGAPMNDWHPVESFDSEATCDAERQRRTDEAIDRARATLGDDAKYDLDVRRAVNARCVSVPR